MRRIDSVRWLRLALALAMVALAGCGGSADARSAAPTRSSDPTTSAAPVSPIVGRWMQVHTCDQLVAGLEDAGLGVVAPVVVNDFFPEATVEELAAKPDLCSGARPQRHYHFFSEAGTFGSLDQHQQPVDDGTWSVDGDVLRIASGAWRFEVDGTKLTLEPIISKQQIRQALADPTDWSDAGWIVAVAYPPSTWERVPCDGWC